MSITNAIFEKDCRIETNNSLVENFRGTINHLRLESINVKQEFSVISNKSKINEITLILNDNASGNFIFNDFSNQLMLISGKSSTTNIVLENLNLNYINVSDFYSFITFSGIRADNKLHSVVNINNSNLSNSNFSSVDFASFNKIEIENTSLIDAIFTNITWFEHVQLNKCLTKEAGYYSKTREVYRQLKYALEKQGDRIQSLNFKHLEMKVYKEDLFSKYKWHQRIFNQDRFILWVGQTNNFGQSWLKPVGIFILFLLPLYFGIMVGVSSELEYSICPSWTNLQTTLSELWKYAYSIPELINPVHSLKKVFPDHDISGPAYWLDFLLKLVSSFFIFQTIAAFRKFMK
jgi:hypothetical protein